MRRLCGISRWVDPGSFSPRNIRVLSTGGEATLVVFNWGAAGWGTPALDLRNLVRRIGGSLDAYARAVGDLEADDLDVMFALGNLFRAIEHLTSIVGRFHTRWIEGPMRRLKDQHSELVAASDWIRRELSTC